MKKAFLKKINKDYLFILLLIIYIAIIVLLANFRDMIKDEALYFHETYLLSELIKTGRWIGDYGVGVHGFIFKLPPALLFLLTGPSVTVVTIYHILLTGVVGFLSYKLFNLVFKNKLYSILTTALIFSNFHFFLSTHTYLREIPTTFAILLFLYFIFKKKNNLLLSISFLLLLDAKEYVFFVFALAYAIWLFIQSEESIFLKRLWDVIKKSFLIFLPSLVWVILMFTTGILPVNMFLASIIGLKDSAFSYLINHFDLSTSTANSLEGGRDIFQIVILDTWSPLLQGVCTVVNIVLSYIGKVLYPRVFSFLSVPKVLILPVVFTSIKILKDYIKEKKRALKKFAFLSLLILVWLLIYILRASHGRYLLPIVPMISAVYLYLLFSDPLSKKQKVQLLIATFLYMTLGFFFETTYILPKVVLEYFVFILFTISLLKPEVILLKHSLVCVIATASISTALLFSYVQGQIFGYMNFGENREASEIAQLAPDNENYWTNSYINLHLISVLNEEKYLSPEWEWKLHSMVSRRENLKTLEDQQSFAFPIVSMDKFKVNIYQYNIRELVLVKTEVDQESYPDQDFLDEFLDSDWLELDKEVEYPNMTIYLFEVKE